MANNTELFDEYGRVVRPVLCNTAKDGSGTWYFALVDGDGHLQVDALSIAAGTNVIGKARLVTATGDEITNDAADSVKVLIAGTTGVTIPTGAASDADSNSYVSYFSISRQSLYNGNTWDRVRIPNVFKRIDAVAITAGSGATVWTPTSTKKFRLMGWSLSSSAGAALEFHDGAVTATPALQTPLLAAAGIHTSPDLGNGYLSTTADNVLTLDVTATSTVSGMVFGTEE